jgi:hypothetical protein
MEPNTNSEPKFNIGFFFLSLGVLISLITSVTSFLNLVFETLNKRFPDVLNASYEYGYATYQYEGIRMALATLIIFFPVFIVVSRFWRKFGTGMIGHINEVVKKWLIYIILFLSSLVVVIDLVTLVRYFVSGEITTRFILKVLTVLITAGLVGFYYIAILRSKDVLPAKFGQIWSAVAVILVAGAVVWSFMIMGSPAEQRRLRLDDRRVGDLQNIQWQVINYWQQKEKLPVTLEDLKSPLTGYSLPVPPEFEKGEQYEYAVLDDKNLKFELCATFALPMPKGWTEYSGSTIYPRPMMFEKDMAVSYPYPVPGGVNESWDHQEGRTCFERTIDKDIYPPFQKN